MNANSGKLKKENQRLLDTIKEERKNVKQLMRDLQSVLTRPDADVKKVMRTINGVI